MTYINAMNLVRPYTGVLDRLKAVGLRPTRQRLALAKLLFEGRDRHVTAEQLHSEAHAANIKVSLATVYNTLHQFTEAELLREVVVEPGRSYFDTNITDHHHFFHEAAALSVANLPATPKGTEVKRVDVIIRLKSS